jgi:hypothetical protein
LTTFIIGTGSTWALTPPRYWYSARSRSFAAALAAASDTAEQGVGTEPSLIRGRVEIDQGGVDGSLVGGFVALERFGDFAVDVGYGPGHALAVPLAAPVTQFNGLLRAR